MATVTNTQYKPKGSIAIVQHNDRYVLRLDDDVERLRERLSREAQSLKGFRVLKQYDGVIILDSFPKIQEAIARLKAGEEVNLETLLD